MFPSGKDRHKINVHHKFVKGEKVPNTTPEQEIMVLEYLLKKLEQEEDYETCDIACRRIQSLKQLL